MPLQTWSHLLPIFQEGQSIPESKIRRIYLRLSSLVEGRGLRSESGIGCDRYKKNSKARKQNKSIYIQKMSSEKNKKTPKYAVSLSLAVCARVFFLLFFN
jgi:hypothetical protein